MSNLNYVYLTVDALSDRIGDLIKNIHDISINDIRAELLEIKNGLDNL